MAARGRPRRVLYVVACGGRPAGDLSPFVEDAQAAGWEVCVIASPSALKFMDLDHLAQLTGHQQVGGRHQRHPRPWAAQRGARPWPSCGSGAVPQRCPCPASSVPPQRARAAGAGGAPAVRSGPISASDAEPGPASRDLFPWQALRKKLAKLTSAGVPTPPGPGSTQKEPPHAG